MGAEKIKTSNVIDLGQYKKTKAKETDIGIAEEPKEDKAKVFIIAYLGGKICYLNLIRSVLEDSRIDGDDIAGGKVEPGELPIDAMYREAGEELPGIKLDYATELGVHKKHTFGYIALASFPNNEIRLSHEHSDAFWLPVDGLAARHNPAGDLPDKYKKLLLSPYGKANLESLGHIAMYEPLAFYRPDTAEDAPIAVTAAIPQVLLAA